MRARSVRQHFDEPEQQERRGQKAARNIGVAQDRENEPEPQTTPDPAIERREHEHHQCGNAVIPRLRDIFESAVEAEQNDGDDDRAKRREECQDGHRRDSDQRCGSGQHLAIGKDIMRAAQD